MAAALPHCDDFLAAHNVDALEDLGRLLAGLGSRRDSPPHRVGRSARRDAPGRVGT
jgi:hypothetical protein